MNNFAPVTTEELKGAMDDLGNLSQEAEAKSPVGLEFISHREQYLSEAKTWLASQDGQIVDEATSSGIIDGNTDFEAGFELCWHIMESRLAHGDAYTPYVAPVSQAQRV